MLHNDLAKAVSVRNDLYEASHGNPTKTLHRIAKAAVEADVFRSNDESKFGDDVAIPPHVSILGDIPQLALSSCPRSCSSWRRYNHRGWIIGREADLYHSVLQ